MKKDVLITVTGLIHTGDGEDEKDYVDVITPGKYYRGDGRHILMYEELVDEGGQPVKNLLEMMPGYVRIKKSGPVCAEMKFRTGESDTAFYSTPFGAVELGIETKSVSVEEDEDSIRADVRYVMTLNGIQKNKCFVKILVQPVGDGSGFSVRNPL